MTHRHLTGASLLVPSCATRARPSPAWRIETGEKYHHVVEPLSVSTRDGKVVVTGKVSGSFPGSPINLEHIFEIEGGRIVSLEIRP